MHSPRSVVKVGRLRSRQCEPEAKQSASAAQTGLDCFVAFAPCNDVRSSCGRAARMLDGHGRFIKHRRDATDKIAKGEAAIRSFAPW